LRVCGVDRFALPILLLGLCGVWAGCEHDLRVPYIPPTLANWPQPYRGVPGLTVHAFTTGYLRVPEAFVLRGGSATHLRELPVLVFLIEHPKHGGILFNTGLAPTATDASSGLGGLSALLGAEVSPGPGLKAQLEQAGLQADAIRWIVLSTMQFEHTGALESFPSARVVVAKAEHEYARQTHRGYQPDQFDDVASWKFIDFLSAKPLATFLSAVDLFDDGSCVLIDASGSTPGTMVLLVRLPGRPLLLADDLAAVEDSLRYAAKPASVYDLDEWWNEIWRLKRFKDLVPALIVVPGHDMAPARDAHMKEIIVHELPTPEAAARTTPTPDALHRLLPQPM
jgi:N-acyl homoserine lactone hydrolase